MSAIAERTSGLTVQEEACVSGLILPPEFVSLLLAHTRKFRLEEPTSEDSVFGGWLRAGLTGRAKGKRNSRSSRPPE